MATSDVAVTNELARPTSPALKSRATITQNVKPSMACRPELSMRCRELRTRWSVRSRAWSFLSRLHPDPVSVWDVMRSRICRAEASAITGSGTDGMIAVARLGHRHVHLCGDPDQGGDPCCLLILYACAGHFRAVFWIGLDAIKCCAALPHVPRSCHSVEGAVTALRLRLLFQAACRADRFALCRVGKSHGSPNEALPRTAEFRRSGPLIADRWLILRL